MYRRTISMTLFNRPHYLRKVLGAMSCCYGIERYKLIICIEPGNEEVLQLAQGIDFADKTIVKNEKVLGCPVNVFQALSYAFLETDYNIHIEDDQLLWKDALLFFEHCRKTYADDPEILSVTAYNSQECPASAYGRVARRKWFTPWAWATWRDRWEDGMKDLWDFDYSYGNWDSSINTRVRKERAEIFPILARVQNIGVEGVHIPSKKWGETFHLNSFWAGKVKPTNAADWTEDPSWSWEPNDFPEEVLAEFPEEWLHAANISLKR